MAKSQVVITLLTTAIALAGTVENAELKDCIEALEFLGEDAKGNTQEYKDLKEVVEKLSGDTDDENRDESDADKEAKAKAELEAEMKAKEDAGAKAKAKADNLKKAKRLSYVGIKQIGANWYSSKDKYKKSFVTADECAKHFNK